jgi:hypothetical protein
MTMTFTTPARHLGAPTPTRPPTQPPSPTPPTAFGRTAGTTLAEVVRWPAEVERRAELARRGRPCVLVVGIDEPPPATELLEDWVREPVDPDELAARLEAVSRRACCGDAPTIDDGLVRHRGAWASGPPAQVGMAELLLANLGRVVGRDELARAAADSGGSTNGEAVKAAATRLGRRLAPLGLELKAVRGRGYLLHAVDRCPVHPVGAPNTKG